LPAEIGGDWDFRCLTTYAGFADAQDQGGRGGNRYGLDADRVGLSQRLGSTETTA